VKIYNHDWFADRIIRENLKAAVPYLKGRLLDAGCGQQPYRSMLSCDCYIGRDVADGFDITAMKFEYNEFDSILCTQVLEHVPDVEVAFREFYRVLKSDGYLCITVPFMVRLHGIPDDYWRFSEYGIELLFKQFGFKKVLIESMGGFMTAQCFLWNYFLYEKILKYSKIISRLFALVMNPIFWIIFKLDKDKSTPFNYIAVAQK